MKKVDHKKSLDSYKAKAGIFRILKIPKLKYIMIDGHGDPNTSSEFREAILALYPVAYKIKFASKLDLGKDFTVMPLEGLWWAEDMRTFVGDLRDKSSWDFSLMIMQPDWITKEIFVEAVAKARKQDSSLSLEKIRFDTLEEGKVVQILHIGSFDNETDVIREMHDDFIVKNKLVLTGKHHEIYLSDFRRTAPEKLRTILRQPVIDQ